MKKISSVLAFSVLLVILIFLSFSFKEINEGEKGVVKTVKGQTILNPGLHFILPWQSVKYFRVNQQLSKFELPLSEAEESLQIAVLWMIDNPSAFVSSNSTPDLINSQLKKEAGNFLGAQIQSQNMSPAAMGALLLQNLQSDSKLDEEGIAVQQLWVTNLVPDKASQTKIFNNMKSLAATISQDIINKGTLQATAIRDQAEQSFLQAQSQALMNVAKILGEGNSAAIKIIAPLYHQNPALFNAYVAAKEKLLTAQS